MDAKNTNRSSRWPKQGLSDHVRAAPPPADPRPSRDEAEAAVRTLIAYAGDDPSREGLLDTPKRVIGAYEEVFQGYRECPVDVLDRTFSEIGTLRRFRAGQGHRLQFALRAPHDAVLRQGARRLYAGRTAWSGSRSLRGSSTSMRGACRRRST